MGLMLSFLVDQFCLFFWKVKAVFLFLSFSSFKLWFKKKNLNFTILTVFKYIHTAMQQILRAFLSETVARYPVGTAYFSHHPQALVATLLLSVSDHP